MKIYTISPKIYAILFNILTTLITVVQVLILAGILPPNITFGGNFSTLDFNMQIWTVVAIVVLIFFEFIISLRAGLIGKFTNHKTVQTQSWLVTSYLFLNTIANLFSPNFTEQYIFTIFSTLSFILAFLISNSNTQI